MVKSMFAATLSLLVVCLLMAPVAYGQSQRPERRSNFGGQQGTATFSQQPGAIASGQPGTGVGHGQRGPTRGQQFGPGQQPGFGPTGPGQGGFVGSDAQDMRRSFEDLSGRQRRGMMFDMMVENLNEMRDERRRRDRSRRRPVPVRVQLRPSFQYRPPNSRQIAAELQSQLVRSADLTGIVAPRVEIVDRTATVSGFVPSERERAVLAKMIALQPGISQVENRLTVDPFAPVTEEPAAEDSPERLPVESVAEPATD